MRSSRPCWPLPSCVLLMLALACQARSAPPADSVSVALPGQPVPVRTDTLQAPAPLVETGCVPDQPRTSYAEVRWLAPALRFDDSVTVDFTVFKDGFQANRYASIDAQVTEARLRLLFRPEVALRAMSVRVLPPRRAGDTTIVRVERLDAGINYLWRLRGRASGEWVAGAAVRVQAPTCVFDEPQPIRQ